MSDDRPPDTGATDASGTDTSASDADGYDRDHAGDDVRAATDRERTTDAVDRTDRETTATAARGEARTEGTAPEGRDRTDEGPVAETGGNGNGDEDGAAGGGGRSDRIAFWVSALFGLALAAGAVALVSGRAPFFEDVMRVRPTVEGGGIGADWIVGNTGPILEAAITIVHLADVVMGIFILLMVFIHWAAFRRLATRMRPPAGSARARESAAATDGGVPEPSSDGDRETSVTDGDSGATATDSSSDSTDDTAPVDGGDRQ